MAAEWEARPLRRLLRLWVCYGRMDLLFIARGYKLAIGFYVSDLVTGAGAAATTFLIAERFDGIGPWSRPAILFMLGYALLVRAVIEMFFSMNVSFVSRRIGRGQLDHQLIQPQPLWMGFLTDGFIPFTGSGMLVPALALMAYSLGQLPPLVAPGWLAALAVNLAGSVAIVLAFNWCWASLAFWAPRGAEEINSSTYRMVYQLKQFPLDGVGGALTAGLVTLLPVGLIAWYPARALIGLDRSWWALAVTPLAALAFSALAAWTFSQGLKQYGRTGSTRYLAWGFRR